VISTIYKYWMTDYDAMEWFLAQGGRTWLARAQAFRVGNSFKNCLYHKFQSRLIIPSYNSTGSSQGMTLLVTVVSGYVEAEC